MLLFFCFSCLHREFWALSGVCYHAWFFQLCVIVTFCKYTRKLGMWYNEKNYGLPTQMQHHLSAPEIRSRSLLSECVSVSAASSENRDHPSSLYTWAQFSEEPGHPAVNFATVPYLRSKQHQPALKMSSIQKKTLFLSLLQTQNLSPTDFLDWTCI